MGNAYLGIIIKDLVESKSKKKIYFVGIVCINTEIPIDTYSPKL